VSRKFRFTMSNLLIILLGTIVALVALVSVMSSMDHNRQITPEQKCHRVISQYLDLYGFENNSEYSAMKIDQLIGMRYNEAMQQSECKSFDWTYKGSSLPDLSGKVIVNYEADGQQKQQTIFLVGRKRIR